MMQGGKPRAEAREKGARLREGLVAPRGSSGSARVRCRGGEPLGWGQRLRGRRREQPSSLRSVTLLCPGSKAELLLRRTSRCERSGCAQWGGGHGQRPHRSYPQAVP